MFMWITALLIAVGLPGKPEDGFVNKRAESSLLTHARQVAVFQGTEADWGVSWLSNHEIIFIRESEPNGNTFFRRDLTTGNDTPLPQLTRLDRPISPGNRHQVSHDGTWFLWQNGGGDMEWATPDGRHHYKVKSNSNPFLFMHDNRHWVEFCDHFAFDYSRLLIYDIVGSKKPRTVNVDSLRPLRGSPPVSLEDAVFTSTGNLRVHSTPSYSWAGAAVDLFELGMANKGKPLHLYHVDLAPDVRVIEMRFSPERDQVAWLLWHKDVRLCVSRMDGSGMYEIGRFDIQPKNPANPDDQLQAEPRQLTWTPHGTHVSFLFNNALYTEVVDPDELTVHRPPYELLAQNADRRPTQSEDLTVALDSAVRKRDNSAVNALIAKGAAINHQDYGGNTALMVSAVASSVDITKQLLDGGADPNLRNQWGDSALINAVDNKKVDAALLLIARGARVNMKGYFAQSALFLAAQKGSVVLVNALLERGADPDITHYDGQTPLIAAAREGHLSIVEALLTHNANVNARDHLNGSALLEAAVNNHVEVCKALLARDADPNVQAAPYKTNGETVLMCAVRYSSLELCRLLVDKGADVNGRDTAGYSALSEAMSKNKADVVRFFLEKGADPNREVIGSTLLISAVLNNRTEIVKALLEHGAKVDAKGSYYGSGDPLKKTALDWAKTKHLNDMVRLLQQAGAKK